MNHEVVMNFNIENYSVLNSYEYKNKSLTMSTLDWFSTPCRRILGGQNVYLENNTYDIKMMVSARIMTLFISLVILPVAVVSLAIKVLSFPCLWNKETVVKTWKTAEKRIQEEKAQIATDAKKRKETSEAFSKAFSERRYKDYIRLALENPSIINNNPHEYNLAVKANTARKMSKSLKIYLGNIEEAKASFVMYNFIERLKPHNTFEIEFYWENVFFPEALNFWIEEDPVKKIQMAALTYELMTLIAAKVHASAKRETPFEWPTSESEYRAFWVKKFINESFIAHIKTLPKRDEYNTDILCALTNEHVEELEMASKLIKAHLSLSQIEGGTQEEIDNQVDRILTKEINQWMKEIDKALFAQEEQRRQDEERDPFGYRMPEEKSLLEKMKIDYFIAINGLLGKLYPPVPEQQLQS